MTWSDNSVHLSELSPQLKNKGFTLKPQLTGNMQKYKCSVAKFSRFPKG